jgi:hypothetical protein
VSADGLERALRAIGIECTVEARDRLAIIIPSTLTPQFSETAVRRAAIAMLPEHGFSHLALEIPATTDGDATLSRD